jgi:hypothetical protein
MQYRVNLSLTLATQSEQWEQDKYYGCQGNLYKSHENDDVPRLKK